MRGIHPAASSWNCLTDGLRQQPTASIFYRTQNTMTSEEEGQASTSKSVDMKWILLHCPHPVDLGGGILTPEFFN